MIKEEEIRKEFENKIVKVLPFEVNGRKYEEFEMRYPTFNELMQNYKAIEETGEQQMLALFNLVKLCTTNVSHPGDFNAFPSYAVFALTRWLGLHISA